MSRLYTLVEGFKWIFLRLPTTFTLPFAALTVSWIVWGYDKVVNDWAPFGAFRDWLKAQINVLDLLSINSINQFADALILVLVFLVGVLIAYDIAATLNLLWFRAIRRLFYGVFDRLEPLHGKKWFKAVAPDYLLYKEIDDYLENLASPHREDLQPTDAGFPRIGIILAGGGAKGAYQAGAMRAVYEYLESKGLLGHVCTIAGTSIGSWNALFWLADMVRPLESVGGKSFHQIWWEHVNIKSLLTPRFYIPFYHNALVTTDLWKEQFYHIFDHPAVRERLEHTNVRFYLTKVSTASGKLEFTTNNPGEDRGIQDRLINALLPGEGRALLPGESGDKESIISTARYTVCGARRSFIEDLRDGVFASMTFPPLIPPQEQRYELFEDGGVIDNLPVYFGASLEACDFLFVLPLNADFGLPKDRVNTHSMVARLARVLTIRQGALEQQALKLVKLYNELAEARSLAWQLSEYCDGLEKELAQKEQEAQPPARDRDPGLRNWVDDWGYEEEIDDWEDYFHAATENHPIGIFAVCPDNLFINTVEFWKTEQAEEAFDLMYRVTRPRLFTVDPFEVDEDADPAVEDWVHIRPHSKREIRVYKVGSDESVNSLDLGESPI